MTFEIDHVAGGVNIPSDPRSQTLPQSRPPRPFQLEDLGRIGIPRKYWKISLGSIPSGVHLVEWLKKGGDKALLKEGATWLFDIRSGEAMSTIPLFARAAFLRNHSVSIRRLDELTSLVTNRRKDELEKLLRLKILIVEDFFDATKIYDTAPFTNKQLRGVEHLLIERMKVGRPSILEIYNPQGLSLNHLPLWRKSVFVRLSPRLLVISDSSVEAHPNQMGKWLG